MSLARPIKQHGEMERQCTLELGIKATSRVSSKQPTPQAKGAAHRRYVKGTTNDTREDEMEEKLTQVKNSLRNLKNVAWGMGSETKAQNQQINWIIEKADTNNYHIDISNTRAKKPIGIGRKRRKVEKEVYLPLYIWKHCQSSFKEGGCQRGFCLVCLVCWLWFVAGEG